MSAQHTPGPWLHKHRQGTDDMHRTEVYSKEYGGIATCAWTPENLGRGVTGTYREANARLIAAAPDLLNALCELVRVCENCDVEPYNSNAPTENEYQSAMDAAEVAILKVASRAAEGALP